MDDHAILPFFTEKQLRPRKAFCYNVLKRKSERGRKGMKRGLVLAGGGARGSYQVGVYQALTELGWRPDVITGTSVGCLNGAMFATGQWATARDMWLTIDTRQVITDPPDPEQGVLNFWQETVRGGGLDVTPLESIVDRVLDEDALRTSPIEFGLVTVNKRNLRPLELTAQQIPQGQMKDYLLASAACFPAFRPRAIEGEQFIDGGYADNMPVGLARRMGAEEVVAVDVDGIGITRRIPPQLPVILVRSHWELGAILTFDPQQARQNIALGYNDTYRAFGRILGIAYSIQAGQERALTEGFVRPYAELLRRVMGANPALTFAEQAALGGLEKLAATAAARALAPLERACELAGVAPDPVYTADELFEEFLQRVDPQICLRFAPLFEADAGLCIREAAQAAAAPGEFLQALVAASLRGSQGGEEP